MKNEKKIMIGTPNEAFKLTIYDEEDSIPTLTVSGRITFDKEKWMYKAESGDLEKDHAYGKDSLGAVINCLKKRFPELSEQPPKPRRK